MYDYAVVKETADFAPHIERAFSFVPRELDYFIDDIEGEIPEFVRGSYYLNAPARFRRGDVRYRHWLDGDGMICALHFGDDGVRFVNRFVRSRKFVSEDENDKAVFRTFGTQFSGDTLKRGLMTESPVNVSVYPFAGKLLAFGEQGMPYDLDPRTLETIGQYDFGGAVNDISPFAAHPKIDPQTGEMFNFGISFSAREPVLNLYCFDRDGRMIYRSRVPLDFAASVHDFGLSENYAVFYISPYVLNMKSLVSDGKTLQESLVWKPSLGSNLLIVSRATGDLVCKIPVGNRYCLHFINCFEEGELLNADLLELERPVYEEYQPLEEMFTGVFEDHPKRLVIDLRKKELVDSNTLDYSNAPDFPSVAPPDFMRSYSDFWMLGMSQAEKCGRKFFDQLARCNWSKKNSDVYTAVPNSYLGGEPVFVSGAEDQAVVICQIFDAEKTESVFAIFNAYDVQSGAVALLKLREPVPPGFHGSFDPKKSEEIL